MLYLLFWLILIQMQRTVGTVIKADEEEDAVGVASVLSTARHSSLEAMEQVQSFILDHCPKDQLRDQLLQVSCGPPADSSLSSLLLPRGKSPACGGW